ncbi:substrate-binding domain-containing protein [Streptomyces sp. NPDC018833]|uniref:substrate-binding domain-containing protein n=1 Tax=Streptomyces sp. NPDC018833 TaxID=3365053 RepID=UPI00378A4973
MPEDVSLAGFDDIPLVKELSPALATVALPLAEMGQQVVALALREPRGAAVPCAPDRRGGRAAGERLRSPGGLLSGRAPRMTFQECPIPYARGRAPRRSLQGAVRRVPPLCAGRLVRHRSGTAAFVPVGRCIDPADGVRRHSCIHLR